MIENQLKLRLVLIGINILITIADLLISASIYGGGTQNPAPLIIMVYIGPLFILNFSYLLAINKHRTESYLRRVLGCFGPSAFLIIFLGMGLLYSQNFLVKIALTVTVINALLTFIPFLILNIQDTSTVKKIQ